ncbi:hypothetical protein Nepgr_002204 [Nepenthes gracilis]|uniref:Late embryogenesis abundant protein LEA-2 subgroup domain-containing protein n=1 Tax=Nepenthes gracilis TaxID=150966 RepID=A0AAD3RYB2_NEPGR|nr:hypothetical protein Nepgr_002204 [Nepenthes gracilis]
MNEDGRRGHDARKATPRGALRRGILAFITTFLLLATITALVVWLIYRPEKPNFTVVGVAIYTLNTTAPPFIETSMQFNLLARNPNRRVSLFYYHLSATVHYRDQAITPPVQLPPLVQERHSTVFLSPVVGGGMIPVSAEVMEGVAADVGYGAMGLSLVMVGRMRYKAGAIRTGFHGVSVVCDLLVGLKTGNDWQVLPLLGNPDCSVDI